MGELEPLILDMLGWIAREPRPYADVIDAWRTSCPRLTVWEEANDRGLLIRQRLNGIAYVAISEDGLRLLRAKRSVCA